MWLQLREAAGCCCYLWPNVPRSPDANPGCLCFLESTLAYHPSLSVQEPHPLLATLIGSGKGT